MANNQLNTNEVLDLMKQIADEIKEQYDSYNLEAKKSLVCDSYVQQRKIIEKTFNCGNQYCIDNIILRLTIIDSLYSTNARYSQYSIEELAYRIWSIGSEQEAIIYFEQIAGGAFDKYNIFSDGFGIQKNGSIGSKKTSLASKYAYYALLCNGSSPLGFPIYDSLVKQVYSLFNLKVTKKEINECSFSQYVTYLNDLRIILFGNNMTRFHGVQQFDILDAYLWRLGKVKNGSFSLLFNKPDYVKFVENLFGTKVSISTLDELKETLNITNQKANFDDLVVHQCKLMSTSEILKGIKKPAMYTLIDQCKQLGLL